VPKNSAFKAPSVAHGIRIGSILRGLTVLRTLGSLWKGMDWVWELGNGIRSPLVQGLVPGKGLGIFRLRGLSFVLLLLNLVSRHANLIKSSVSLQINHIGIPRIKAS